MQKLKHTPSPWIISWNTLDNGEHHGIYADGQVDLKEFKIAFVNGLGDMRNEANEETGKANAKLIAAAPELLDEHITDIKMLEDILNGNSILTPIDRTSIEAIIKDKKIVIKKATR